MKPAQVLAVDRVRTIVRLYNADRLMPALVVLAVEQPEFVSDRSSAEVTDRAEAMMEADGEHLWPLYMDYLRQYFACREVTEKGVKAIQFWFKNTGE